MERDINELLDRLVLRTQDKHLFNELSPEQRAVSALELLLGTATRSSVETFFSKRNSFLYQDVNYGLELIEAYEGKKIFLSIIRNNESKQRKQLLTQLQANIIGKNFILISNNIKKYVCENFSQLSINVLS